MIDSAAARPALVPADDGRSGSGRDADPFRSNRRTRAAAGTAARLAEDLARARPAHPDGGRLGRWRPAQRPDSAASPPLTSFPLWPGCFQGEVTSILTGTSIHAASSSASGSSASLRGLDVGGPFVRSHALLYMGTSACGSAHEGAMGGVRGAGPLARGGGGRALALFAGARRGSRPRRWLPSFPTRSCWASCRRALPLVREDGTSCSGRFSASGRAWTCRTRPVARDYGSASLSRARRPAAPGRRTTGRVPAASPARFVDLPRLPPCSPSRRLVRPVAEDRGVVAVLDHVLATTSTAGSCSLMPPIQRSVNRPEGGDLP